MGDIQVTFNEHNEVAQWVGNPIYLDHSMEEGLILVPYIQ